MNRLIAHKLTRRYNYTKSINEINTKIDKLIRDNEKLQNRINSVNTICIIAATCSGATYMGFGLGILKIDCNKK